MSTTIPLCANNTPRVNWYILYGWILFPHKRKLREAFISHRYNLRAFRRGESLSTKFSSNHDNLFSMFFEMIRFSHGLTHQKKLNKYECLAAGGVVIALYSMTKYGVKEPSISKARHIFLHIDPDKKKKYKYGNTAYLRTAVKNRINVLPYCAALATFHNQNTLKYELPSSSFSEFLKVASFYKDFCYNYTTSRSSEDVDAHKLRASDPIQVSDEFEQYYDESFCPPIYTEDELRAAYRKYSAPKST